VKSVPLNVTEEVSVQTDQRFAEDKKIYIYIQIFLVEIEAEIITISSIESTVVNKCTILANTKKFFILTHRVVMTFVLLPST
jgi:hypothetical protein